MCCNHDVQEEANRNHQIENVQNEQIEQMPGCLSYY
jgi:hypothetical protein